MGGLWHRFHNIMSELKMVIICNHEVSTINHLRLGFMTLGILSTPFLWMMSVYHPKWPFTGMGNDWVCLPRVFYFDPWSQY